MSLKWRLFLWIGTLFVAAFVFSYFWETYLTDQNLKKAQAELRKTLLKQREAAREQIEDFIAVELAETQANVDALLQRLAEILPLKEQFAPNPQNIENGTWMSASAFLVINKWIGFLQNTNEGKVSSLIIPNPGVFQEAKSYRIDQNIAWVTMGDDKPYIGIRLPIPEGPETPQHPSKDIIDAYLLFEWKNVLQYADSWKEVCCYDPESIHMLLGILSYEEYQASMNYILSLLEKADGYLKKAQQQFGSSDPIAFESWIKTQLAATPLVEALAPPCTTEADEHIKDRLQRLILRDEQAAMIWHIASLLNAGPFGTSPFNPKAPVGSARFINCSSTGKGFMTNSLLYATPFFDEAKYYNDHAPDTSCWQIGSSLSLVSVPNCDRLFIGNVLQLENGDKKGYLTIGVSGDEVVQKLSLVMNQMSVLVNQNAVVTAYSPDGVKYDSDITSLLPIEEMLSQTTGILEYKGVKYFFIHMVPMKDIDLHFFLINEEAKEFAVLHHIESGSKLIVEKVSNDMRFAAIIALLIALFFLQNMSNRITRPIRQLAAAAKTVAAGHLQDVQVPLPKGRRRDEIYSLCHTFAEMVTGLLEKEKVKAVLNKVVSHEIAEEILKGNVHLGGEEKVVTVLFGDIRHFTMMTQNMEPQKVIQLLNTCMTKISSCVDKYQGVIDKYVGDEIMALFGAPIARENSALEAVLCAIEMKEALAAWNLERTASGLAPVTMGIGIHTGVAVAGNMGAEDRLNYTVIGSSVNLASRLCSSAKEMQILISKHTFDAPHVKESIEAIELPPMMMKGFDQPVPIYEVIKRK